MGGNFSAFVGNVMGFLGFILNLASLTTSTWTSSEVVSSGLFKKCILYPGQEECSEVAESSDLEAIKSSATVTPILAFIATALSCSAGESALRKGLSAGLFFVSAITGFSSGTSYRNSFSLCSGASYGAGYIMMTTGSTFNLFASLLHAFSMCSGSRGSVDDLKSAESLGRKKNGRLRRPWKKIPGRLKRFPAKAKEKFKSFKKRKRKIEKDDSD